MYINEKHNNFDPEKNSYQMNYNRMGVTFN